MTFTESFCRSLYCLNKTFCLKSASWVGAVKSAKHHCKILIRTKTLRCLFLQVKDIKQSHLASHLMPNQQKLLVLLPRLFELLHRVTGHMPFRMNRQGKNTETPLGNIVFLHSQISIVRFLFLHLQWWPEPYNAVNWEELQNMSRPELIRWNLGDAQHT